MSDFTQWMQQFSNNWNDKWSDYGQTITENGVFQGAIDSYLKYNMTQEGMLVHWANIIGSNAVNATSGINRNRATGTIPAQNFIYAGVMSTQIPQEQIKRLNDMYEATKDPNIEGIPIKSPEISVSREVEVSEYGVIMDEGYMHSNVVDNAVPKPRVWTLQGYITNKWDVDIGFILKPSLTHQERMLDGYAKSRRPLWFKTDENEFVRVQIASMTINRKAENMNGHAITLQLKEFVPLELFANASKLRTASFVATH